MCTFPCFDLLRVCPAELDDTPAALSCTHFHAFSTAGGRGALHGRSSRPLDCGRTSRPLDCTSRPLATQQPVPTQPVTVEVQDLQGQLELKAARAEEERKQAVMRMILARMLQRTTAQALDRWVEVVEAARHSIKP